MPEIRPFGKRPRLVLIQDRDEDKSGIIIGYAFVALLDFVFGLFIGWLIWGQR